MQQATEQDFKILFDREYNNLCRYAWSYMQDEHMAEDIVQETFIKIWEQKPGLINSGHIKYYLVNAVRNNCISEIRKQQRRKVVFTDTTPEPEPEPFFHPTAHAEKQTEEMKKLANALNQLPPKCKEVFLLIKLHGMSYKQAAETLDISVKTIENQMGKAIKIFKELRFSQMVVSMLVIIKYLFLYRGLLNH